MKHDNETIQPPDSSVRLDETAVCEDCGRVGAYRLGDHALCLDCYSGRGSCCPEFGRDDLWTFPEDDRSAGRLTNSGAASTCND